MKFKLSLAAVIAFAMSTGIGASTAFAGYNSKYFTDVNENNYAWSADAVDYLHENNVVAGVGNNKFAPENMIKRGDFAVLVNNAFNLKPFNTYSVGFSDVNEEDYYYTAIINAKGCGIIEDQFAFYPQQPITRGAAMCMLYRALDQAGYVKAFSTDLSMYSDADSVLDTKSKIALATLTQMGIVSGSEGRINYADTMTRAEMAMVFYKTLTYMEENASVDTNITDDKTDNNKDTDNNDADNNDDNTDTTTKNKSGILSDETLKTPVTIDGSDISGIENSRIRVSDTSVSAVTVANKTDADIEDSVIHATGSSSNAVAAYTRSDVEIENTELLVNGNGSNAVMGYSGSTVTVKGGSINVSGKKSSGVRTGSNAEINNADITVTTGCAVTAEDAGKVDVTGCTITASGISNGVFTSVVGEGDSINDEAVINVKDCEITGDRRTVLFYANNNNLHATLENCTVNKVEKLVDSSSDIAQKGKEGSTIVIDLINQKLEADVICDSNSRVVINLKNGSYLKASVNEINIADYVEINVEEGSTLELTTDSYIDLLTFDDAIDIVENGRIVYYDPDLAKNEWLFRDDYSLSYGGFMSPQ